MSELTIEQGLLNDAMITGILKQIIYNAQKTNEDAWRREINDKEKSEISSEISKPCKYPKMNKQQPSKPVLTANSSKGFEKDLDDASTNLKWKGQINPHPFLLLELIIFRRSYKY
jgi:hypothetical protein